MITPLNLENTYDQLMFDLHGIEDVSAIQYDACRLVFYGAMRALLDHLCDSSGNGREVELEIERIRIEVAAFVELNSVK